MPILDKLRNIFTGSGDGKKKVRHYQYIKRDADPNELWEIVGELGDGAFGKVFKVLSDSCDTSHVCCHCIGDICIFGGTQTFSSKRDLHSINFGLANYVD